MLHKIGIITGLVILAIVFRTPQAQAQACYNCVYNQDTHVYSCLETQGGYGYGCYTPGGTPCTFRGVCGGTRPLADGSAIPRTAVKRLADSNHTLARPAIARNDLVATRGKVTRGCGGAILSRHYDAGVQSELRAKSRDIIL